MLKNVFCKLKVTLLSLLKNGDFSQENMKVTLVKETQDGMRTEYTQFRFLVIQIFHFLKT